MLRRAPDGGNYSKIKFKNYSKIIQKLIWECASHRNLSKSIQNLSKILFSNEFLQRLGDLGDGGRVEVGVHGEGEDGGCEAGGNGTVGVGLVEGLVDGLAVHWDGIVYHRGDALLLQGGLKGVALLSALKTEGILCPTAEVALGDDGGAEMGAEALGVGAGGGIHGIELILGEGLELDLKDGGLKGVETGVHADAHVVVLI